MALVDCPECSARVSTSAGACPTCGFPLSSPKPSPQSHQKEGQGAMRNTTAKWGMISGIVGCAFFFIPFGHPVPTTVLPCVVGIIGSSIALGRISRNEERGQGMAITGLVCGIIGLLLGVLALIGVAMLNASEQ